MNRSPLVMESPRRHRALTSSMNLCARLRARAAIVLLLCNIIACRREGAPSGAHDGQSTSSSGAANATQLERVNATDPASIARWIAMAQPAFGARPPEGRAELTGRWRWRTRFGTRWLTSVCMGEGDTRGCVLVMSTETDNTASAAEERVLARKVLGWLPLEPIASSVTQARATFRGSSGRCGFTVTVTAIAGEDPTNHENMGAISEPACDAE